MFQEDNSTLRMQPEVNQTGIEPITDKIFEGITNLLFLRLHGLIIVNEMIIEVTIN